MTHSDIVRNETIAAYADCWHKDENLGYKIRNLNYRASFEVSRDDAISIMDGAVKSYNEFEPKLLKKFPKCATFQLAREGSVCVYVRANGGKLPSAKAVKADEKHEEGELMIYWWD